MLIIAVAGPVLGGDWKHAVQACRDAAGKPAAHKLDRRFPWEDCILKLTGIDWLAPSVANIAPGSSFAPGLRTLGRYNRGQLESEFVARGNYSLKNFYFMEGRYDAHFPFLGNPDEKATFSAFARRMDLRRQDFYGLGQFSSHASLAQYRHQQDEVGVAAYLPFTRWFAAAGALQRIAPAVHGVSPDGGHSVETVFPASQLPGFAVQPTFFVPEAQLRVHTPFVASETWTFTDLRVTYDYFHDVGAGVNTFHKLQFLAEQSFDLRVDIARHSLPTRKWWQNAICHGIVGDQCRIGTLVIDGLTTMSFTPRQNVVPFYLQETLGGADIHGFDTLRGLADYRLRAPNRVLLQADLYHDIWGPIGVLAFYDTGRVGLTPSDLSFSQMRHDFGIGAYIRAGGNIVLRAYIAFGGAEGTTKNVKLANAF
jgi:hypothetical protein